MEKFEGQIVGITGNIGSGKSTVVAFLKEKGCLTVDCDALTPHAYLIAKDQLLEEFGSGIFRGGEVDKKALASVVFGNSEKLARLNEILHPIIFELIVAECEGRELAFVEVPLLFEAGFEGYFSQVWLVVADREQKLARTMLRDGLLQEDVEKRLSFQQKDEEKMDKAHIIIKNNADVSALRKEVEKALLGLAWKRG